MTNHVPPDLLADLSAALQRRVREAAHRLVALSAERMRLAAILWRGDLVVASEQSLPDLDSYAATLAGGAAGQARLVGRDPGTNIAVLRLAAPVEGAGAAPEPAAPAGVGALTLVLAPGEGGEPTARLALLRAAGAEWSSMAGGRIDQLLKLDLRLMPHEDGGPVVDAAGGLLGMATAGPRGRALVIPHATLARAVDTLERHGGIQRGWIGVGLQPVAVPEALRDATGQRAGLMVMSLAPGGPAEQAGLVPGDILLSLDGKSSFRPRAIGALIGADRVGQPVEARLLRAGTVVSQTITVGARPAA